MEISLAGTLLIIGIVLFRALMKQYLPQSFFMALWRIAAVRLLLPLSLASRHGGLYMVIKCLKKRKGEPAANHMLQDITSQIWQGAQMLSGPSHTVGEIAAGQVDKTEFLAGLAIWIWFAGFFATALYFVLSYRSCQKQFRESLPVKCEENSQLADMLTGLSIRREVRIRTLDRISSPLTYGILSPVILLPKKLFAGAVDEEAMEKLSCIITHEAVHIKRMDALMKMILAAVLSIHWFNPFVWMMYILAGHDMELSCDEAVIRRLGDGGRVFYASLLLHMEAGKQENPAMYNYFSRNIMEERITQIMNKKKITAVSAICAVVFVFGAVFVSFAKGTENTEPSSLVVTTKDGLEITVASGHQATETGEQTEQQPDQAPESVSEPEPEMILEENPTFTWVSNKDDRLTSAFGERVHPITGEKRMMDHITLSGGVDGADIYAAADAVVKETGFDASEGNYILLDHGNNLWTKYTHCKEILVKEGDMVGQGDTIASMGKTGRATGICLGFYVYKDGTAQNPLDYLPE